MTTHPKREYTQQDILGMANALRGIQGRASYVNKKLDEAADMLESLASQLAAQKREGEPRQAPAEVMMHWKPMLEWALGTIAELGDGEISGEDSILYAQAKMLCLAGAPSPDQDREVSP